MSRHYQDIELLDGRMGEIFLCFPGPYSALALSSSAALLWTRFRIQLDTGLRTVQCSSTADTLLKSGPRSHGGGDHSSRTVAGTPLSMMCYSESVTRDKQNKKQRRLML